MKKTGLLGVFLCLSLAVHAVQYKATILSNPFYDHSYGVAIDSGRIAGSCSDNQSRYYSPSLKAPMLWANSQSSAQSLSCGSYIGGSVTCMQGNTLGGSVSFVESESTYPPIKHLAGYASTWSASTGTRTNLHPTGYIASEVSGCWGNQQVGYAKKEITSTTPPYTKTTYTDAILWNGSAENYVNLRPWGYNSASASAIWENTQVGDGQVLPNSDHYALMWHGTATGFINLHPSLFKSSVAVDVWGNQQVGAGSLNQILPSVSAGASHALLWTGSADSYVDLHPDDFYSSYAYAVCNNIQVGAGRIDSRAMNTQALLWTGSADSVVNLHQFLSSNYVSSSASDIDEFGNILGSAKYADGTYDIVLWQVVPEPSTLLLLGAGCLMQKRRRKPKKV